MPANALNRSIRFEAICTLCKAPLKEESYTCSCGTEAWRSEYRNADLSLKAGEAARQQIRKSFNHYSFDSQQGMLQYEALPGRSYASGEMLKVGATPLLRLREWEKKPQLRVWAKSEGHNPSGCFKDRETMMCLLHGRKAGFKSAVIYSSGNAAASAAIFAQKHDLRLVTFVPGDTYPEKINFIRAHGSDVIVIGEEDTAFEAGYRLFARLSARGHFLKRAYDNWSVINPYRVEGDKTMALEIVRQLMTRGQSPLPDWLIVPTANGSCLAGIWKGFKELRRLAIIDSLPRMVSAGIRHANPVLEAVKQKELRQPVRCDLSKLSREDTGIGSIILAEEGYDSMQATRAVLESGGTAVGVTRADIELAYHQFLREEADLAQNRELLPEPASLITLAAITKLRGEQYISKGDSVVCILTGSGFKARKKISSMLSDDPTGRALAQDILERKAQHQYPEARNNGRKLVVPAREKALKEAFDQLQTPA